MEPQYIDGKRVRKFLFMRYINIVRQNHVVEVHAFTKDHAADRLETHFPHVNRHAWDFIQELEPEHFLGKLGETLPLLPHGVRHAD